MNGKALIYLWTRDGGFPVNEETEGYIIGQIKAISQSQTQLFSDVSRAEMAERIIRELVDTAPG